MSVAHAIWMPSTAVEDPAPAELTLQTATRPVTVRTATPAYAPAIYRLITDHLAEGHLLPREAGEIAVHAHRFVVAVHGDRVLACAELAPLGPRLGEIRSLVVDRSARGLGVGQQLVGEILRRADAEGFHRLCAFTHAPAYFVRLGFSIVPHAWLPEKIDMTCRGCASFRRCGQYAVVKMLHHTRRGDGTPSGAQHA